MIKKALLILSVLPAVLAAQEVVGAGATFPAPLYSRWAADYHKETGIRINYQSIGSGAGLKQVEARTVTFGASDMPLRDPKDLIQFPTVIGGVVPVINVEGIKPGELRLTGAVLGDIYLGRITRWNDPQIVSLNPSIKLPDEQIMVIRRADGSGTTFIWTNYLSKVNQQFQKEIGEGTAVNWKVGAGGKGNEGVAAFVTRLKNSIGYVEYAYVKQNKMNWVVIQNAAGVWVQPNEDTFRSAARDAVWGQTFYQILTNQSDKNAWPITGATFVLMPQKSEKPESAQQAVKFFKWAFKHGHKAADDLDYVMLPTTVINLVEKEMEKIK